MKLNIILVCTLLVFGLGMGIYYNLPQETIQFIEIPSIKLAPIIIPNG